MKNLSLRLASVLATVLPLVSAQAITRTYNCNSANNQWSVAANWSPVGVPQNGDVLVFSSLAGNRSAVNDLVSLRLDSIQVTASSYEITGNAITISNGISVANAPLLTFNINLTLGKTQTISVDAAGSTQFGSHVNLNGFNLTINTASFFQTHGAVTGIGNLSKIGSGEIFMSGAANTFVGTLVHNGGQFSVAKASCFPTNYQSYGLTRFYNGNATHPNGDVILYPGAKIIGGNPVTNTLRNLTLHGATIEDLSLTFALNGNITTFAWDTPSRIIAHLDLVNTNHTFNIADGAANRDLEIQFGNVRGGALAGFTKMGNGKLYLYQLSSTFSGTNHINAGIVELEMGSALLGNGRTIVNDGGSIQLLSGSSLNSFLELHGNGAGGTNGAIRSIGLANVTGTFLIPTSARIRADGELHLSGNIGGAGQLIITGTNQLWTQGSAANTLAGGYRVESGTFVLNKPAGTTAIGSQIIVGSDGLFDLQPATLRNFTDEQIVSHVFIATSGRYELNGRTETVASIDLNNGADVIMGGGTLILGGDLKFVPSLFATAPAVFDGGGFLNVGTGTRNIIINGDALGIDILSTTLTGSANVIKKGNGNMRIRYETAHTGTFTVEAGDLEVTSTTPFGTAAGPTVVTGPGALVMSGDSFSDTEPMIFNGTGRVDSATLVIKDNTSLRGPMTLSQNTRMSVASGAVFTLYSPISGPGALIKDGPGEMFFDWDRTNTFTGGLWVREGLVRMARGAATNLTIPSILTIGDGVGVAGSAHVISSYRQQIGNNVDVTVHNDGRLTITNMNEVEIIRRLQGPGHVQISGYGLRFNDTGLDSTFSGTIGGSGELFKAGAGKFTHTGSCNANGMLFSIFGGTVAIDGIWNASPTPTVIDAWAGTTLSGSGIVQNVIIRGGATLAPGNSTGILTMNNLSMSNTANLFMELRGTTPGAQHDQIVTKSSVNISNAILTIALSYPPVDGDVIRLVDNQSANAVLGTFSGKPQGSIITEGGNQFVISYTGGTGNDITLTATNSKLALGAAIISSGNGLLDSGECNELYVVLTNKSGGSLFGVTAILNSRSPGIAVSQQMSAYPNFTAGSTRTNLTPFRISTLPGYICGQTVELQLIVSVAGSTFAVPFTLTTGTLGVPTSYNSSVPIAIPDFSTTNSTINVAGFPGFVNKVTVSFHITHTFIADLDIWLQSPSGKLVKLVADRGGSSDNFGTSCSPLTARTTFDDTSRNSITLATTPFAGTFSPEEPLSNFMGELGNGAWKLILTDDALNDIGTLNCWTLTLYRADCAADSLFACQPCTSETVGVLNAQSPTMPHRMFRDANPAICGETKICPGISAGNGTFRYRTHTYTNTGPSSCVTVVLQDLCANRSLFASAYSGSFNPADLCANYLADVGTNALAPSMSFYVPSNGVFTIVVNEIVQGGGCASYKLELFGLQCPPPRLFVEPVSDGNLQLYWNAIGADGYHLQAASDLSDASFTNVNTAPAYFNGVLSVTNNTAGSQKYFRLNRP